MSLHILMTDSMGESFPGRRLDF